MRPRSFLLFPPRPLASCVFAALLRDTRGAMLADAERLNHFPASPLVSATRVLAGEIRLLPPGAGLEAAQGAPALPDIAVVPPSSVPVTSWSPGPVFAITLGFFPEAWQRLGFAGNGAVPPAVARALRAFDGGGEPEEAWNQCCAMLLSEWQRARAQGGLPDWPGSHHLADWSRSLLARVAVSGPGRSARAWERRLKRWSGQSRQSLDFYTSIERLHRLSVASGDLPLASLAAEAGFADQSHMGRAVRRATGFSPARLNRLIENDEAFWCYRLLGERF